MIGSTVAEETSRWCTSISTANTRFAVFSAAVSIGADWANGAEALVACGALSAAVSVRVQV